MTHRQTAYAQLVLSVVFITGYFIVFRHFIRGEIHVPAEWKDSMETLLGVLTSTVVTIIGYWFSRQRSSDDPKPKAPS